MSFSIESLVLEPVVDDATCSGGACNYQIGDMKCGSPADVASYNGDCATWTHPRNSHW